MKSLIILFSVIFIYSSVNGQVWSSMDEKKIIFHRNLDREIIPTSYSTFKLNIVDYLQRIKNVTSETKEMTSFKEDATMDLPMPDGSVRSFFIWESSVMEESLASKYPDIRSFKGKEVNNPRNIARFSLGKNGFHAAIKSDEGMIYIDPYAVGESQYYISYFTANHVDESLKDRIICGTDEAKMAHPNRQKWGYGDRNNEMMMLRKYRLALACTGEWGAVRATKEKALSDMVTFIERANVVFESELALTLILIGRNDELIFLNGDTDPYQQPNQGLEILTQNTNILNNIVGQSAYEIGHVFSICFDVGGVAGGNICTPARGAGVTCHNSSSINNGIVLVFNHEVGHQMTAAHTFNNCPGQEGQQSDSGYEPGSGSTIMAYPGACGSSNLGVSRDAYYHVASLEQILTYTNTEGVDGFICAEKIDINNFKPIIELDYIDGFTIPKQTPFYLKGQATDGNNDAMTYSWEQFDNSPSSPLGFPAGNAPIFRSLKPSSSPIRFFPTESRLLNGQFSEKTELLPTYTRNLNFMFVVRDNHPLGSAAVWKKVSFKVDGNAGPFKVNFPNVENKFKIGETVNVLWDVANTNVPPVNCKNVDIYIALNNSLNFDGKDMILVSKATPNDGNENIVIPNVVSTRARIVIKASDNIFLTTALFNSRIDAPEGPYFFTDLTEQTKNICLPDLASYEFTTSGYGGMDKKIKFELVTPLPTGVKANFSDEEVNPGENVNLTLDLSETTGNQSFELIVRSYAEGVDSIERKIVVNATSTDLNDVKLNAPLNGLSGVGPTQTYTWEKKDDAEDYDLEVSSSPQFLAEEIIIQKNTANLSFNSNLFLNPSTVYYWRVRSNNACKKGEWSSLFAFQTKSSNCYTFKSGSLNLPISGSGSPKIETKLEVDQNIIISDVNVKNIIADHQWSGDLQGSLTAPSGKKVILWSKKCGSSKGLNLNVDDQSNLFMQCPINLGNVYRPEQALSVFNQEDAKGTWTFLLEDLDSGNGGRFKNVDLEICSDIAIDLPFIEVNNGLRLEAKQNKEIGQDVLLIKSNQVQANGLTYVIVQLPKFGILTLQESPLKIGDTFTQDDINSSKMKYYHTADLSDSKDKFSFIVEDNKGGWIQITDFKIEIDLSSSTQNLVDAEKILVFPNPFNQFVTIKSIESTLRLTKFQLTSISGTVYKIQNITEDTVAIDLEEIPSGVYILKISTQNGTFSRKLVKY